MADGDAQNIVALEDHLHDLLSMMINHEVYSRIFSSEDSYVKNPHWMPPLHPTFALSLLPNTPGSKKGQGEKKDESMPDLDSAEKKDGGNEKNDKNKRDAADEDDMMDVV